MIDSIVAALAGVATFAIAYVLLAIVGGMIGWTLFGLYLAIGYVLYRFIVYAHTGGTESVFPWRRRP